VRTPWLQQLSPQIRLPRFSGTHTVGAPQKLRIEEFREKALVSLTYDEQAAD
jgi:hypothetical protein